MIKLFDSIASLEFIDSKTTEKKVAAGMHAKDGEYVKFNENCDCTGPVSSVVFKSITLLLIQFVFIIITLMMVIIIHLSKNNGFS
jgi:hypothetical protein